MLKPRSAPDTLRDERNALFAWVQVPGQPLLFASYSTAVQSRLGQLGIAQTSRPVSMDGIGITVPDAFAVPADYYGVVDPGVLPMVLNHSMTLFGLNILADPRTEISYSFNGLTASETAPGELTVTAIEADTSTIIYYYAFAGVIQGTFTLTITKLKDPPPLPPPPDPDIPPAPPPPGPPPPPPQTGTQEVILAGASDPSSYALLGLATVEGGYSYKASLASSLIATTGTEGSVEIYIAYRTAPDGAWTQVGPLHPAQTPVTTWYYEIYISDWGIGPISVPGGLLPGFISFSQDIVLPSGTYQIGFFGKQLYTSAVTFDSKALVEAI